MAQSTFIEWTNHTFNPWWGCTKVSDGCDFCYAEAWAGRFGHDVWGKGKTRRVMSDTYWGEPLKWNASAERLGQRARVFCASMADVFDPEAPDGQLERLWGLIRRTPWLDWQLLTKRPARIREGLPDDWGTNGYPNVWLGTSIENQSVTNRVSVLISNPAAIHFLSVEPLIEAIPHLTLNHVEWVIVGGESGSTPRPIEEEWVLDIQLQCKNAGAAFFFKQWGGVNKKAQGRLLNGRTHDALPQADISFDLLEENNNISSTRRRKQLIST